MTKVDRERLDEAIGEGRLKLGGNVREASVLVVQREGMHRFFPDPQQASSFINRFYDSIYPAIYENGGVTDYISWQGATAATFGKLVELPDHLDKALSAALSIRDSLEAFLKEYRGVRFGIGIASGKALIGNIGNQHRMDFAVCGEPELVAGTLAKYGANYNRGGLIFTDAPVRYLKENGYDYFFGYDISMQVSRQGSLIVAKQVHSK